MPKQESAEIAKAARSVPGAAIFSAGLKVICGIVLIFVLQQCWLQLANLNEQETLAQDWSKTSNFAVFYPQYNGDDLQQFQTGGNETELAEARDLYPILDARGALYVDASSYGPGTAGETSSLPTPPIVVNTNYLKRYPLLDESGRPIRISESEDEWIVAVPGKYRSSASEIANYFEKTRVGSKDFDGAVQGEKKLFGDDVPSRFLTQRVRIIWTKSGQSVFSFNSTVNPHQGNMVRDPIVEVMTLSNSLPIDRVNAITGNINTPLKVRIDSSSAETMRQLAPTLRRLKLDDNLKQLVTGNEGILEEVDSIRTAITWFGLTAAGSLLVILLLASIVTVAHFNAFRRMLVVRRLHGFGWLRMHKELLKFLGIAWIVQVALGSSIVAFYVYGQAALPFSDIDPAEAMWMLLAILVGDLLTEAAIVFAVSRVAESRAALGHNGGM